MNNTTFIRNCYLVFCSIYLLICFLPIFSGTFQTVLQKWFWLVLIVYAGIEFVDNQVRFDEG